MQNGLTKRQKEFLEVIYAFIKDTGYPPTFEEMRLNLGVSSNQSVVDLLFKLESKGLIKKNEGSARGISITSTGYEVLKVNPLAPVGGTVSAGMPLFAESVVGEWAELPFDTPTSVGETFVFKISGDSMINAGIDDGDAVLVSSQKEFVSGNIVLARIGDSWTLKRFMSDDRPPYRYLKPENPKYKNILFDNREMELQGRAIAVFKHNNWKPIK